MVKIVIHGKGDGTCVYSGKPGAQGLVVSFEDGTLSRAFLSDNAFLKFVRMKAAPLASPPPAAVTAEEVSRE